jgi:hypothetical protein
MEYLELVAPVGAGCCAPLLLSAFMQAGGAGEPDLSRLNPLSGKVDGILIGEGFAGSRYIQRLAARLPVVVIAGTPGVQAADVVAPPGR